MRKARAYRRALVSMELTGNEAWLVAMNVAHPLSFGIFLVRRIDWVKASAMVFRSAVSLVHAARSTRLMIVGAIMAARMAMTAITAMLSIKVQPFRSRKSEFRIPK